MDLSRFPKRIRFAACVGTLLVSVIVVRGYAIAGEFEFRFNPPNGITCTKTMKQTRAKDMGALGKQVDESELVIRETIVKEKDGYRLTAIPLSFVMKRNGKKINDPMMSLIMETVSISEITGNGRIASIKGHGDILKKLKKMVPGDLHPGLQAMFSEETLVNKSISEWNARIGDFAGQKVKLGDVWTTETPYVLPNGKSIQYYGAFKVLERTKCGQHECLRITFSYDTDAEGLNEFLGKTMEQLLKTVPEDAGKTMAKDFGGISGVEISGRGERLIDPTTMLIFYEKNHRDMKMQMEIAGQGKKSMIMTEQREYTYDYAE